MKATQSSNELSDLWPECVGHIYELRTNWRSRKQWYNHRANHSNSYRYNHKYNHEVYEYTRLLAGAAPLPAVSQLFPGDGSWRRLLERDQTLYWVVGGATPPPPPTPPTGHWGVASLICWPAIVPRSSGLSTQKVTSILVHYIPIPTQIYLRTSTYNASH